MNQSTHSVNDSGEEDAGIFDQPATLLAQGLVPGFVVSQPAVESAEVDQRSNRKSNKPRDFSSVLHRFERRYFNANSVYSKSDFERRFRVPRTFFSRIEEALQGRGVFTL